MGSFRVCNDCGEQWRAGISYACPYCDSEDTYSLYSDELDDEEDADEQ